MQKFINEANKLGIEASMEDFSYDTNLQQFTLDGNVLQRYVDAQKEQLKKLGLSGEAIETYINDQTSRILQTNMDVTSILDGMSTLEQQQSMQNFASVVDNYLKITYSYSDEVRKAVTKGIISTIYNGGEEAVKVLKQLKGKEVTSEEISAVYNAGINRLNTAEEALASGAGTVLTGLAAQIARTSEGIKVTNLPDGSAVITSVTSMVDVYANLYARMKNTAEATTSSLNAAYAKLLTAADQKNIDALETLQNASSMTYEAFGELLASYDIRLEDVLNGIGKDGKPANWGVEQDFLGNIRITDFDAFAKQMKWDINSPEYAEAYSQWVDSMAELQNKPISIMESAAEQLQSLAEAKVGQAINVSYLEKVLPQNLLKVIASRYGAELNNGLLTITNQAKLPQLITMIANQAARSGVMIPDALAKVADAVAGMLDNIVNLIKNGITGSLSNADANTLQQWADQFNIDLDFTKTAEGLKLSEQSAIALYNKLKDVDSIKAKLVFDELNNSLKETNLQYRNASSIAARILELQNEIAATDKTKYPERVQQYEDELTLAKEIYAVRSTTEDDSFNFMSGKIPSGQNNPINYYNNWAQAIQTLRDAQKSYSKTHDGKMHKGLIDYQDYYNIITEINNLAALGEPIELAGVKLDGSMEAAAKLIQKGAEALTVDSAGNVKVALGDIGIDFKTGTGDMSKGIDIGIKNMAKSQVDMLNALISLLEAIVAMEELGDLDLDGNGIDLSELFEIKYDDEGNNEFLVFNQKYEQWRQKIIDQINEKSPNYNKDLAAAINGITIGDFNLSDIINWDATKLSGADKNVQKAYTAFLTAFSKAAKSGNYDLDNIRQSVLETLKESGLTEGITLDIGGITWSVTGESMISIDWQSPTVDQVLQDYKKKYKITDDKAAKKQIADAVQKFQNGNASEEEVITALKVNGKIKVEEGTTTITVGGKTHEVKNGVDNANALSNEDKGWLNAAAAEALGFDLPDDWQTNVKDGTLTLTQKIGKTEVQVTFEDGKPVYHGEHGDYNSQQELLDGEYTHYVKELESTGTPSVLNKDQWVWWKFRIPVKIKPTFKTSEGEETDPSSDPELKQGLKDLLDSGHDGIEAFLNNPKNVTDNGDGTYTVSLLDGKRTFTFTGGEDLVSSFEQQLGDQLGIDVALSNTISNAISNAFATEEVQTAISTAISSGLANAVGSATSSGETPMEIPIPKVTIKPTEISVDTSEATVSLTNPQLIPVEVTSYTDSGTADTSGLTQIKNMAAIITQYQEAAVLTSVDTGSIEDLTAFVSRYEEIVEGISTDGLTSINQLTGLVKEYKESPEGADQSGLSLDNISAKINAYIETVQARAKKAQLLNALKGKITSYDDTGASTENLQILDLNKIAIDTTEAETELDQWISDIEQNKKINIKISPEPPSSESDPPSDNTGYGTGTGKYNLNTADGVNNAGINQAYQNGTIEETTRGTPSEYEQYQLETQAQQFVDVLKDLPSEKAEELSSAIQDIDSTSAEDLAKASEDINSRSAIEAKNAINGIQVASAKSVAQILSNLKANISTETAKAYLKVHVSTMAKGNVALAGGTQTLMGELGPELVVSNGRYFVVGQQGAEFVDLDKDAIVFNHRQTERLLTNGGINSRGRPYTNETNAISFAKGNISGDAKAKTEYSFKWDNGALWTNDLKIADIDIGSNVSSGGSGVSSHMTNLTKAKGSGKAMASASAALAALKELRAQWQALLDLNVKDLAGKGGGGGGGGNNLDKAFIKELERWYNWLQKIAQLETEINHQEQLRNKISSDNRKNGAAYYRSQKESLKDLKEQIKVTENLMVSQQKYFTDRRNALNKQADFSSLYTFDENGQLQYNNNKKTYKINGEKKSLTGFEFLSELNRRKANGQAVYTAKQQVQILKNNGFGKYMEYDSSGNKIDTKSEGWETTALQAFYDKIDADREEMQSLHDSINEYSDKVLELQQKQNELLQEMQDNQMEVENAVLDAMVETREREIDELTDLKDAYSKASEDMVNGLNEALNKEREAYNKSEEDKDLLSLRRRLQIAQRSGAPASEIASLQEQIRQKSQDAYFNEQEQQINALQEAANKQIEKMEKEIDILTETLEYQKKYGLLWDEVAEIMAQTPSQIAQYLQQNTEEFWGKSALAKSEDADDWFFKASQWAEFRKDLANGTYNNLANSGKASTEEKSLFQDAMKTAYGDKWTSGVSDYQKKVATNKFAEYYESTGDFSAATQKVAREFIDWKAKNAAYKKQFGNAWTGLDSDTITKIKNAYVEGGDEALDAMLTKQKLWTFKAEKGVYSVVPSTDPKKAWTKDIAQKYANRGNDWNAFIKKYPLGTNQAKSAREKYYEVYKKINIDDKKSRAEAKTAAIEALLKWKWFKEATGLTKVPTYDIGGMVDTTGLALLHAKEGVLTPEQTDVLRNEILGGQKDSLMNLLLDFRKAYTGIGNVALAAAPNVVIENASVNMNVGSIANDYDARRAGEQALTEMLRIARKTGSANSISRR